MNTYYLLLSVAVLLLLAWRTFVDKHSYEKFKKIKKTTERQYYYKRWVAESFVLFLGLTGLIMLLVSGHVQSVLDRADSLWLSSWDSDAVNTVILAVVIGMIAGAFLETFRGGKSSPVAGDFGALLPRNKQEIKLAAALSVNAGIVEELFFRLALPALLLAATGSASVAILSSIVVFGLAHWYQGWMGVLFTGVVGAFLMAVYLSTGSILLAIGVHILIDLRSLVIVPLLRMRGN